MSERAGRPRIAAAFFDVDETLITVKSMFGFLAFHLRAQGLGPDAYDRAEKELKDLAAQGVPREETNRLYYRHFAGHQAADVAQEGRRWFARELARDGFFHPRTLHHLRAHHAEGTVISLVSGSFPACLDPIAAHVGAHRVLCTRPRIENGVYTGELDGEPVIGEGKARAVRRAQAELGIDADACVAYGDHGSDLPMLLTARRRIVVGTDPALLGHLPGSGWSRLHQAA
ncbi:HAD family hydrolase [Streptomyces sp. NPDC004284]|uniref:HAD family hydrolase n=1 Tax=Streptomyces sp. NPDC004284 TaxID=3364695 RepID=UPI0036BA4F8F